MKLLRLFLSLILGLLTLVAPNFTKAADTGAGYSISKIKPPIEEANSESSFFDLVVYPGQEFVIQTYLKNYSQNETIIKSEPYTTFTNSHGEISYTAPLSEKKRDKSLKLPFASVAEIEDGPLVILKGNEEKVVSMKIKIPATAQNGVILGSWYFEKKEQATNQLEKENNTQMDNCFAYALAVKLTVNQEIAAPNLNLLTVEPALDNYRKVIHAQVQADQAAIVSELDFEGRITRKGKTDTLFNTQLIDRTMAPNSNFNIPFYLANQQLVAGEYTLYLTAKTTDKKWEKESWRWTKDFKVSKNNAEKINQAAINDPEPEKNYLKYILLAIIILLFFTILFMCLRNKSKLKVLRK
ncbi:DUF916 and DUF3324 domain-containing protein [Enterococcus sp. ALS3]|uniref:DUF916 and DUF3324 domain-containing protein n=1 Tax=Enterococcus alishanensis TaxID=1303817 RepID=A0ABS6TGU1_9ENTE|nr:DUF916 and DUF3324 domain-containing protein [Enterococcus alishanensis]